MGDVQRAAVAFAKDHAENCAEAGSPLGRLSPRKSSCGSARQARALHASHLSLIARYQGSAVRIKATGSPETP
jgi:hypothetical protein